MRLTIAITTYQRPDALFTVLWSLQAQSVAPEEVIVADDGSGDATRAVIEQFTKSVPYDVHHVRQEHEGFRVSRLRNLAIARATGEYVVLVDGDMVLHPEFIADHRRFARKGCFVQGVRIPLDASETAAQLQTLSTPNQFRVRGRRRFYQYHNRALASLMRYPANALIAIKSCNQGFWREDLVAVNGFDEDFIGWGSEDKDLCARLVNNGVTRHTLLFGGIAYHLHHPPASRSHHSANEGRLALTRGERRTRCARGLDAHLGNGML